jgi:hypothetical protein
MAEGIELSPEEAREQYCYLITTGRVSGKAHEVEMWFAVHPDGADLATVYCLSGGRNRSDWVKNVRANPDLRIRIRGRRTPPAGWWSKAKRVICAPARPCPPSITAGEVAPSRTTGPGIPCRWPST